MEFIKSGDDLLIERTNPDETIDTITLKDYFTTSKLPNYISFTDIEGANSNDLINCISETKAGGLVLRGTDGAETITAQFDLGICVYTSTAQALADENVDMTGLIAAYTYDHTNWTQT